MTTIHEQQAASAPPVARPPRPSQPAAPPRRPGRPRSDRAEEAILDAVLALFGEGETYDSLSMELIASSAGVGKATIYRRWPNKEALVIAAIGRRLHPDDPAAPPGRSVREDLVFLLELMRTHLQDDCLGSAYNVLAQLSQSNPNVSQRYHEQVIEPRRELFRVVLRRGVASGELRADVDIEAAMLMLTGTVLAATRHQKSKTAPVGREFCLRLVDYLLDGVSAR
jgi:AcrR family transcriptional regulator